MTYEMKLRETYYDGVAFGRAEGKAEGKAEGITEGISIGKAEGIVELMWLRVSKDFDEIAKTAHISVDEVKRILNGLGYGV